MSNTLPITKLADLGYDCYPLPDTLFDDMLARMQVILGSLINGVIISATRPDPSDRDKGWIDTVDGNLYLWQTAAGDWARQHPFAANSAKRVWFPTTADMQSEDGGNNHPVTVADGPFWIEDTTLAGKFPLGAGTLPSGAVVAETATGGEDLHLLTIAEMPKHQHPIDINFDSDTGTGIAPCEQGYTSVAAGEVDGTLYHADLLTCLNTHTAADIGGDTAHNVMSPYLAGVWAKRSGRIWMIAP